MDEFDDGESEDHLDKALAIINEIVAAKKNNGGANGALDAIREKLFEIRPTEAVGDSIPHKNRSMINHLTGQGDVVEAVIEWLAKTGRFKKKSIRRARRIKIFELQNDGTAKIRAQPLSEESATMAIAILSAGFGGWITWVLFVAVGSIDVVAISYVLGVLFGHSAGTIIDKSFRFARLKSDVLQVAPWLDTGVSVSCKK